MIPCIHKGEKTDLTILYKGKSKDLSACCECITVIHSSEICEIVENQK